MKSNRLKIVIISLAVVVMLLAAAVGGILYWLSTHVQIVTGGDG